METSMFLSLFCIILFVSLSFLILFVHENVKKLKKQINNIELELMRAEILSYDGKLEINSVKFVNKSINKNNEFEQILKILHLKRKTIPEKPSKPAIPSKTILVNIYSK